MANQPPKDDFDREAAKLHLVELLDRRRRRHPGDKPRKVAAISLALALGVRRHGSADSRKRGVRGLVDELRAEGVPVSADLGGYWIAEAPEDHAAYQAFMQRMAKAHLAAAAQDRRSSAADDARGQLGMLPDQAPTRYWV